MSSKNQTANEVDEILRLAGLSDEQRKKVFMDLEQAVLTNFTRKIFDRLPEKQEQRFETPEAVIAYVKNRISEHDAREMLVIAMGEILSKFLENLKR